MNKKIIGIMVCMLFFGASVCPNISGFIEDIDKDEIDNYNTFINQIITSGFKSNNNWSEQDKLLALDGESLDRFGESVSIYGDHAIIGAPYVDDYGTWTGAAYVFFREGLNWNEQQKIQSSDIEEDDFFGCSVSIDDDTVIIGAAEDDANGANSGSAYVFIRSGTVWTEQAKLIASDGEAEDDFGCSVSLDGDTAIIGAFFDDDNGVCSGSAYIFTRSGTTWTQQAKLLPSDGLIQDRFGISVSIDGDYAVIGAYGDDEGGSAYVFKRSGTSWTEQAKLLASDGHEGDEFGYSVSLDGDTAIIGAHFDDDNGFGSGSAYIFTRSGTTWTQQAKLLPSDITAGDRFGTSVSIVGDTALIGSKYDDDNGDVSGSAYVFKRSGTSWSEDQKLLASDGQEGDKFGYSVSINGNNIVIGARQDDDNGDAAGSAYIFIKDGENQPPSEPTITGPIQGKRNIAYPYTLISTDPDDHDVCYYIRWGDGDITDWTDFQASGLPGYTESHSWDTEGEYIIQAKAKDINDDESDWTVLIVDIPRTRAVNYQLFHWFSECFPLLERLLILFRVI